MNCGLTSEAGAAADLDGDELDGEEAEESESDAAEHDDEQPDPPAVNVAPSQVVVSASVAPATAPTGVDDVGSAANKMLATGLAATSTSHRTEYMAFCRECRTPFIKVPTVSRTMF